MVQVVDARGRDSRVAPPSDICVMLADGPRVYQSLSGAAVQFL